MKQYVVKPIGAVEVREGRYFIRVEKRYIPALKELDGFGHVDVFWWFSKFDSPEYREIFEAPSPYKTFPDVMGIFATRSPIRPNPIALTASEIIGIDHGEGVIEVSWIDADDGTPVIDLKPYTPSSDRVENPRVPSWCGHWPRSVETSGDFDWGSVFNW